MFVMFIHFGERKRKKQAAPEKEADGDANK